MTDGAGGVLLVAFVVVAFFVVAIPGVFLVNRAIGRSYDAVARSLEPMWQAEGVRYVEDEVRTRTTWVAPLAVAIRWPQVGVRVTSRGIYIVQSTRMFGVRIGQPIIAIAQPSLQLDPAVAGRTKVAWLKTYPHLDGAWVVLEGGLGVQRFTMRLQLREPAAFLVATGAS